MKYSNITLIRISGRWYIKLILLVVFIHGMASISHSQTIIQHTRNSGNLERLAATEVRKYIYLRTDSLLEIVEADDIIHSENVILLATDDHPVISKFRDSLNDNCPREGFIIKTVRKDNRNILIISGYDSQAVLYGAYRFAENLGIGFDLAGDIIPDKKIGLDITGYDEKAKPMLATRGIQPFHDFFEGPDLWSASDYEAIISQLPKLGMNFIGLHTYPTWSTTEEKKTDIRQGPEPTVWIGLEQDINKDGTVNWSYPAYYAHTHRPHRIWGYDTLGTSHYHAGASELFSSNKYGADVFNDILPIENMQESNTLFNRTGQMFNRAFTHARFLNVNTAIGTELTLGIEPEGEAVLFDWNRVMPPSLQEKLSSMGKDPGDPAVVKEVYKGIFKRITETHPLDYYWLWSWEVWSLHDPVTPEQIKAFKKDIQLAHEALQEMGNPFQLGLGGWILGTADDPAVFDDVLPSEAPFFSLWDQADGFEELSDERIKWPATWLEEDWGLIQPQLELHRIYDDISAALSKNCHGMIAKHWRTRVLGGNTASMKTLLWAYSETGAPLNTEITISKNDWIDNFYLDWSKKNFGPEAADAIADIFASLDKAGEPGDPGAIPQVSGWDSELDDGNGAPGAIMPNEDGSWEEAKSKYDFVNQLEKQRSQIKGNSNLERFDYWLKTMQSLKMMGEYGYIRYHFEESMRNENFNEALTYRIRMARLFEQIITLQLEKAVNVSDLGEIINLEILNWHQLMESKWDDKLTAGLGSALPDNANPSVIYQGEPNIIVTTRQTQIYKGDKLTLEVKIFGDHESPVLNWKPLEEKEAQTLPLDHVSNGVYRVVIPESDKDFEYNIQTIAGSETLFYPAGAPQPNQVVIVLEAQFAQEITNRK